jgi:hypothetical protein
MIEKMVKKKKNEELTWCYSPRRHSLPILRFGIFAVPRFLEIEGVVGENGRPVVVARDMMARMPPPE